MYDIPYQPEIITHAAHFEKITSNLYEKREEIKQVALRSMDHLEGWCSKEKASVMIDFVMMLNAKTVVEIGVFGGKSLIPMAFAVKELGYHGKVYGIDPWSPDASMQGMDGVNKSWWGNLNHDMILHQLKNKISHFGLSHHIVLIRNTSEAAPTIPNIDILHIDGNHSDDSSMIDVTKWVPQVRKGGLIFFDDITWSNGGKAVSWLDENCVRLIEFAGGENEWGIWVKP